MSIILFIIVVALLAMIIFVYSTYRAAGACLCCRTIGCLSGNMVCRTFMLKSHLSTVLQERLT